MIENNPNPKIQFFKIADQDHFSVIAPLTEMLAKQISQGHLNITSQTLQGLQ